MIVLQLLTRSSVTNHVTGNVTGNTFPRISAYYSESISRSTTFFHSNVLCESFQVSFKSVLTNLFTQCDPLSVSFRIRCWTHLRFRIRPTHHERERDGSSSARVVQYNRVYKSNNSLHTSDSFKFCTAHCIAIYLLSPIRVEPRRNYLLTCFTGSVDEPPSCGSRPCSWFVVVW